MLIEDLIRQGRPLLQSKNFQGEDVLRLISDVEDERVKNFYRHIFVVEVPTDECDTPRALPMQQFGEIIRGEGKENFAVDKKRAVGAPFVLPSGGNPINAQGRYLPVYPCYDRHFQDFRESAENVKNFLVGRLERTIAFSLSDNMVRAIAFAVHQVLKITNFGDATKILGVLVLARCGPDGYYKAQAGNSRRSIGERADGTCIVPNIERILEGFWASKLEEGKEVGSRLGPCSFTGVEGEVVSAYCKAWPWAFPTWTCPLPQGGAERMLVESMALSPESYQSLTLGACVFNRLTKQVDKQRVVPELFSPADTRVGKEQAKRRKDSTIIYGSAFLLPIEDQVLNDPHQRELFVQGVRGRLAASRKDPTLADSYMTAVTGFDTMLPQDVTDKYRLTLLYFSGEVSRGDVHLRAYIQDVIPSTLRRLDKLVRNEAKIAMQLVRTTMVKMSEKQIHYLASCYESVPYLLTRAYGGAYLWQQLEAVLHHQPLDYRRVTSNASRRMQSLTPKWPDSRFELFEEVGFYLSFLRVLDQVNREFAGIQEDCPMKDWKDLLASIDKKPITELELAEPAEIGFACGVLMKRFSRAYYKAMKASKSKPDFLRDRVLTFGSELRVEAVYKGLTQVLSLPNNKLRTLKLNPDLAKRTGNVINAFERAKVSITKSKDAFLAAFWSGYALEGYDRPVKPKNCPHCGKPITAQGSAEIR